MRFLVRKDGLLIIPVMSGASRLRPLRLNLPLTNAAKSASSLRLRRGGHGPRPYRNLFLQRNLSMKLILSLLGVVLLIVAAVYF